MNVEEGAVIRLLATEKDGALRELSGAASRPVARLEEERVYQALTQRERIGTTGIGGGVALPHAKVEGVQGLALLLGRSDRGILYDSVDRRPVQILVLLLGPPGADPDYLQLLGRLGRILRDENNLVLLLGAREPEQIRTVFTRMLQSTPATHPAYPLMETESPQHKER